VKSDARPDGRRRAKDSRAARGARQARSKDRIRRAQAGFYAHRHKPASSDITHGASCTWKTSRQLRRLQGLNKLSLDIDAGELRCIIGPNGAGKTTMMDIITGKTRPDSGTVFFGRPSTCCA
jgi:urea transport system ATP-binding protein